MEEFNDYLYPREYIINKEVWLQYVKNCNIENGKYVVSDGLVHHFKTEEERSKFVSMLPEVGRLAYIISVPMDGTLVL